MERGNAARQAFAHYLFSRIQAAYLAYVHDQHKELRSVWWHKNLTIEMV